MAACSVSNPFTQSVFSLDTVDQTITLTRRKSPTPRPPTKTTKPTATPTSTPELGIHTGESAVYTIQQKIKVENKGPTTISRLSLTVALLIDAPPYQEVLSASTEPKQTSARSDSYGNQYSVFDWYTLPAGASREVTLEYRVRVTTVFAGFGDCSGDTLSTNLSPEKYIESDNPEIISKAKEITEPAETACGTARLLYEFIIDSMEYEARPTEALGALNALRTLQGDCTDFSDLMVAFSRASKIPARSLHGATYEADCDNRPCAGLHSWVEIFLPGIGWVPVDPTYAQTSHALDLYFAAIPSDRFIVSRSRNLDVLRGGLYTNARYWYSSAEPPPDVEKEHTWTIHLE
jgi:hypothetical protein